MNSDSIIILSIDVKDEKKTERKIVQSFFLYFVLSECSYLNIGEAGIGIIEYSGMSLIISAASGIITFLR